MLKCLTFFWKVKIVADKIVSRDVTLDHIL